MVIVNIMTTIVIIINIISYIVIIINIIPYIGININIMIHYDYYLQTFWASPPFFSLS